MEKFIRQQGDSVLGVLHGFDRLRFRGTVRLLASVRGLRSFLGYQGVLLKEAGAWMQEQTERVKKASLARADQAGRPVVYVNDSSLRKEDLARQIARRDGIRRGLICVLTAVEPCTSFDIQRNRQQQKLELVSRWRKCLHLYHYFQHEVLGLMHLRLQTWFPFNLWCCVNGREWLSQELNRHHIGYLKRENCLVAVADVGRAQALADEQVQADFAQLLQPLAEAVHPLHRTLFPQYPLHYYWSCQDSEWASDVMFRDPAALAALYPHLLRHGMQSFSCRQVMRFLGRKVPTTGRGYYRFAGEVVSDLKERPEGIRLKHSVNGNSIKMYDKQGSVLRIETTITQPRDFKVYRGTEAAPDQKRWRKLRKGVVDLRRRAKVSQAANTRYAAALATAQCRRPLKDLADPICRPTRYAERPVRAINPWAADDVRLLTAVNRGEFAINGFRNRDLRALLYDPPTDDPQELRRRSAAVTRKLRQLRAHGLIKKVPRTHRYVLTTTGQEVITGLLAARAATVEQLLHAA